ERARSKKLTPDDVTGGTFTITNPGPYSTLISAPIINQPQVAILSTDGVRKKPVVVETPAGDSIAINPVGIVARSWYHRAIDGAHREPADRGGDVTYHGPGQLVGYPIVTLPEWRDGLRDVVRYVRRLEAVLIAVLADLGVEAGVEKGLTGVWAPTPSGTVEKI